MGSEAINYTTFSSRLQKLALSLKPEVTKMALSRVDASSFPRQLEVPTCSLMTVLWNPSGHGVALANKPDHDNGSGIHMLVQLTCDSFTDDLTCLIFPGSPDGAGWFETSHAPVESAPISSWTTTTSVDTGWTEVVIQEGRYVLSDVSIGCLEAEVSASINDVLEAADFGGLWLDKLGGRISYDGACGYRGYSAMKSSSISYPSFNEVTI